MTKRSAVQTPAKKKMRRATLMPLTRQVAYTPSNRLGGPFPVRKRAQLVYTEVPNINLSVGSGSYVFRANDLFDPNFTGTGGQPMYFDQMMEIYNHFTVTSSFIEIQPMGSTASTDFVMSCWIDDDTTFPSSTTINGQRPGAKFLSFNPGVSTPPVVRLGWNAERNYGPNVLNNSLFRGNAASSPTEQMYYVIQVTDLALGSGTLPVRIKITYNAEFTELKTIAAS